MIRDEFSRVCVDSAEMMAVYMQLSRQERTVSEGREKIPDSTINSEELHYRRFGLGEYPK